jgi:cobalt-zinc-cadmium efflux system membrane fusion protein
MKNLVKIPAMLCAVLFAACGNNKDTKEITDVIVTGDTIIVTNNSSILEQIKIQKAQLQDFSAEFKTVGTVRPVTGKLAEIAPPFAGRIVKSFVQLGKKVSTNLPIFELSSSEFYEVVKSYFAAQSANEVAQRNCNRQKELAANGVAAQKDLEQDNDYVFVESVKGKFVRRKVVTESLHRNEVRIISGITEGESVVIEGGIYLQ